MKYRIDARPDTRLPKQNAPGGESKPPERREDAKQKNGGKGKNNQTLGRLLKTLGQQRWRLVLAVICALAAGVLQLFAPMLIGRGIDRITAGTGVDFDGLARIVVILLGIYLLASLLQWCVALLSNVLAQRTVADLRSAAFNQLSRLPLRYYDMHAHGDVMSRLGNDIDAVSDGLQQSLLQLLTGVVAVLGTFVFMWMISPLITAIVLVLTPMAVLLARFIASRSAKMFRAQSRQVGKLNGYAEEMIAGHKEVLLYGRQPELQKEFEQLDARLYKVGQSAQFYSSLVNPCTRFVNNIAYIAVGVAGGITALAGSMTVGNIATMLSYATQFARPINEISGVATQLQAALASASRIFALIDEEPESPDRPDQVDIHDALGRVEFKNVRFSYVQGVPLLTGLNLKAQPGQSVAIVGPTGAGKTTLVNLLMRFYEVDGGSIRLDSRNTRDITRDSLRASFAMVLQDTWLFQGSIRENIAYSAPDATEEQIVSAAKRARAHSFIKRLPQGYDTRLEEMGGNLSQGERQLLTIARALLLKPPMLILDEATSSVDTRTEREVQKAFNKAMDGRTSFVIAHRLSTIQHADLILVMRAGDIVEQGNHEELLAKKGLYSELYHSQFAGEDIEQ